jgi:hypothetical protein
MPAAFHFDNQFPFKANEINDVSANRRLPAELAPLKLPRSQTGPETRFGVGHIFAKVSSELVFHVIAGRCANYDVGSFDCFASEGQATLVTPTLALPPQGGGKLLLSPASSISSA